MLIKQQKKKNQKQTKDRTYKIVCPYATETTTMSYKYITWSK
jgi:hypothetical protein